jgi:hypothetical protein
MLVLAVFSKVASTSPAKGATPLFVLRIHRLID